jgi:hypothetical protein
VASLETVLEKLSKGIMLEEPDREVLREQRRNEPGSESPCPFCKRPRVRRDVGRYVRCNPCGINWLDEENIFPEYLDQDPTISRHARVMAEGMGSSVKSKGGSASTAVGSTSELR